jgi:hypothetical protein
VLLAQTTEYPAALRFAVLGVGLGCAVALLIVDQLRPALAGAVVTGALVAGLAGPAAYTLTTVSDAHSGSIVTAGPASVRGGPGGGRFAGGPRGNVQGMPPGGFQGGPPAGLPGGTTQGGTAQGGGGMGGLLNASTPSTEVVAALSENAASYTWVAATVGSQNASGLQLGTQLPVMAIGGFNGSDPSPTLAQFQQDVAQGRIHWYVAGGMGDGGMRQNGGSNSSSEIASWVESTFTAVTVGSTTMYDLSQGATA